MTVHDSIAYSGGYKYQLRETAVFQLQELRPPEDVATEYFWITTEGVLTIRQGYAWDGCSGPTWDTKNTMRAGLAHDALYQMMRRDEIPRNPAMRAMVDREFYALLLKDGVWPLRAKYYYKAVRKFGEGATLPSGQQDIEYAP